MFHNQCHIRGCITNLVAGTKACEAHQADWRKYKKSHSRHTLSGIRRRLQRPDENVPWQANANQRQNRAHDDDGEDEDHQRTHYFGPAKYYCVETICAPCGVVKAWTKFDKSESPTKIIDFIRKVFPTPESQPSYLCIDKACQVLRTAIANRSWEDFFQISRLIVDSFHYINHRVDDLLCRKW